MRIDTPQFDALNRADVKEPRFVVRIVFDVDSIAITSNGDITGVNGTVIHDALIEPNLISQQIRPDDATSEIGSASFQFDDTDGVFTGEAYDRLTDGSGLRRRLVQFYLGYKGLDFAGFRLSGTQQISNVTHSNGRYDVDCLDIQRSLRVNVFQPKQTTLRESVSATQTTIPLTNAVEFLTVFHGTSYTDAPSQTVGYIKIKKEVIRYTGKTGDDLTGCTRGLFGTTPAGYTVDGGTPAEQREQVKEFIYLELPALKLAYAVLTGMLYNDGQTLPTHWHLGIDPALVVESDYISNLDLWNPADDTKGLVLRFLDPGSQDGKRFLEKEVYLAAGVFSPVDVQGRLGVRRMNRLLAGASTVFNLDALNTVNASQISHEMDDIHNIFSVKWSYDTENQQFRRETKFVDVDSFSTHGPSAPYELSFKGLTSSRHTDAVIFGILDMIRERYAGPPITMSVELLHSENRIEIGDVVRVNYPHIKDFNSATGLLDRAMEVQRVRCNHRTGRLQVDLFGSTSTPIFNSPSNTGGPGNFALNDGFYTAVGTPLASAPGITITSGIITAATAPLAGTTDVRAPAAVYYHNGDLTLAAGVVLTITGNVQLRVKGFFTVNGEIRGIGGGHPGTVDDGRLLSEVTNFGTKVFVQEVIDGIGGYVGNSKGEDGWLFKRLGGDANRGFLATRKVAKAVSKFASAPNLLLATDGLSIDGLPVDLRGSGGPPGGRPYGYDAGIFNQIDFRLQFILPQFPTPLPAELRGGAGVAGGAGLLLVCRGSGMGVNGKIDLSGSSSASTAQVTVPTITTAVSLGGSSPADGFPGAGGAGGPGTMYILLDGSAISVPDYGNKFVARTGNVPNQGIKIPYRNSELVGTTIDEPISGHDIDDPYISGLDLSGSCLRIQYLPSGTETPTGDIDSKPAPPTGLSATGVELGVELQATVGSFDAFDTVEFFASTTNDRTSAGLITEVRSDRFRHQLPGGAVRYYWSRKRGIADARGRRMPSDFFPVSPTDGVIAAALTGGSGADGQSIEIQYSADGITFHDPPDVIGDVFLRQRIGGSGAYGAVQRFVGEQGDPGADGERGNFIDFIFRRSATTPATPTGNSPAGWFQTPPASDGNPLFVSRGERDSDTLALVGVWSAPQILVEDGQDGLPGVQGPGGFTWAFANTGIVVTPDSVTKVSGSTAYTTGAYSLQSYSRGSFASANPINNTGGVAFGLNTDPATDGADTSIDYGWKLGSDGVALLLVNGSSAASDGAYTAADNFGFVHDAESVMYFRNGVLKRTETLGVASLFLDVSIRAVGAGLTNVRFGPSGSKGSPGGIGPPAKQVRLSASGQAFTFTATNVPNPSVQTVTLTATRTNIGSASAFSTTPNGVALGIVPGNADARTLSVADFGGNNQVRVRVEAEGFFDEITIYKLVGGAAGAPGQSAITGFLTNESHTLAADPDGAVQNFTAASGLFKLFEGIADRSSSATFAISSLPSGITAQINTAVNTPVAGQPAGFYRVTALTADQGVVGFTASFGSVTVEKVFSLVKSKQGKPGDGINLLDPTVWRVGTTGDQGAPVTPADGRYFKAFSTAGNSQVLLSGSASGIPPAFFGGSEPLWQARPDGGYDCDYTADPTKSYRHFVAVWFDKLTGSFFFGPKGGTVRNLNSGALESNPYFYGSTIAALGVRAGKWYVAASVVHATTHTAGYTGVAGLYDPETGSKLVNFAEYRSEAGVTLHTQRCYQSTNADATQRQYMTRPRVEQLNGNEVNLFQLMGFQTNSAFIGRNGVRVAGNTIYKESGTTGWNADAFSLQGYLTAHVQWKRVNQSPSIMVGLNSDPLTNSDFASIDGAWLAGADNSAQIYENGVQLGTFGSCTPETEFAVLWDGTQMQFYKDRVLLLTRSRPDIVGRPVYMDSSFFDVGGIVDVLYGPGAIFQTIDTSGIGPNAATEVVSLSGADGQTPLLPDGFPVEGGQAPFANIVSIVLTPKPFSYLCVITAVCDSWRTGTDTAMAYIFVQAPSGQGLSAGRLQPVPATSAPGTRMIVQHQVSVAAGVQRTFSLEVENYGGGNGNGVVVNFRNVNIQAELIKR